jgi:hypothetical protein
MFRLGTDHLQLFKYENLKIKLNNVNNFSEISHVRKECIKINLQFSSK